MATANDVHYRLGLDVGTNSIGWAAVELNDDDEPCGILRMGVRVFPDGRNPKDESSNAVKRRTARGQRRRRDRYLKRRDDLMRALIQFGLMPQDESTRKDLEKHDPYAIRARALDDRLEPHELGRAIFHLNQRRGFKSNRKASGAEDEKEAKKTRAQISALRASIEKSGARTLGEFLARRHEKGKPIRAREGENLYPDRAMYEREFDDIRKAQTPYHDLDDTQWDCLRQIILFQRPLKPVDPGWCQLEPGEPRAAKALPIAQEFRMLQEVNNLKILVGADPERPLDADERKRAIKRLRSGKDINLKKKPTRDLGLPSESKFNLLTIKGDQTAVRLMKEKTGQKLFGDRWLALLLDARNDIVRFLLETEDPDDVACKAKDEWGLDDAQAEAVANVALPSGYLNLSEKAIAKLLPHMENGCLYSDAVTDAGYAHHSDFRIEESHERLPYYGKALERDVVGADPSKDPKKDGETARYGRIGNPTVHIGLNQIRRVVNQLIGAYGKPEEIVVELARDLKMNRERKQKYKQEQRKGGERNERLRECLESAGKPVTSHTLLKLQLWEEQGLPQARKCPYTGKVLSFEMVTSEQTEIDHILPFSKTLDDSRANKVVCAANANRDKGDRAPYEAFGRNPPGYDYKEIRTRAADLPPNKRWRFHEDAMKRFEKNSKFLDRQLNETRYLSRTARTYLSHLYDEKSEGRQRVRVIPGHMTALLRRAWGLEGMLRVGDAGEITGKQRDDHRHHAIDAFVVANTTQGLLQRFAQAAGSSHDTEKKLSAVAGGVTPWDGFHRNQLKPFLDDIVISYKPDHGTRGVEGKTTGQLHNETAYGLIEPLGEGEDVRRYKVVVRKELSEFKKESDLDAVRDPTMRNALQELWDEVVPAELPQRAENKGVPIEYRKLFAERAENKGVPMPNGARHKVRRVRVVEEKTVIPVADKKTGKHYKGYEPDNNEFADIWRLRDGTWQMVVVPTFDANQPGFDIERFRHKDKKTGKPDKVAKPLMRLHIDDMGALGMGTERHIVRVRKITDAKSGAFVVLDDHNEANVPNRVGKDMKENRYSVQTLQRQGFRKVDVDEIGQFQDPGPRS